MTDRLLSLDDPAARDPLVAGAKAAWLAEGRLAGLRVLPGLVVPADCSAAAFAAGASALVARGSGGARLVVGASELDGGLAAELATVGARLGDRLVVRSSSRLEAGGEWAGAFTSYVDLPAADVAVGVRGCWASAFGVDALRRFEASGLEPGGVPMAVLLQPFVPARGGGSARLDGDVVEVVAGPGSPADVLQGWEPGFVAPIGPDDVGELRPVADAVRQAFDRIGATAVEWAQVDGEIVLLQLGVAPPSVPPERPPHLAELRGSHALALARLVRRAPGRLGESLVLRWGVAAPELVADLLDRSPGRVVDDAEALAGALTAGVWAQAAPDALAVLSALRGPDPSGALRRVAALPVPDPAAAARVVEAFRAAAAGHENRRLGRRGIDRWEPFSAAVAMANAEPVRGVRAAGGVGAGRLAWVPDPRHAGAFRPRDVLVAPRPIPQLAPLLWDAAGLVTLGGGPGAHLLESARALGIPAVTGVDAGSMPPLPPPEPLCIAIDGWAGDVFVTPW